MMVNLRPLELRDAPAVYEGVDSSRDALRRWMVWYHDGYSLADAESWLRHTLDSTAAGTAFHFAILDAHGEIIGVISLEDVAPDSGRAMLGYWLVTRAAGRGLGRQAVAQALTWARCQDYIRIVWALVADANVASRRVLEVNGFRRVAARGRDQRGDLQLVYELELSR